jgi:phage tail-like protein
MADRTDPLRGFRYVIEIDGIASGGFSRVKGLTREVRFESHREGGVNDYEHKLVTQITYPNLVLERGLALDNLWLWAVSVAEGDVERKSLWVRMQDEAGQKAWAWHVENALPVKWSSTDLDAQTAQVVMESVEFAHHGLTKGT